MPKTHDLFDTSAIWVNTPTLAFTSWLKTHPKIRGARSQQVYTYLFEKFIAWLEEHQLSISKLDKHHCLIFLAAIDQANPAKKKYRYRYLRFLERVFHHLVAIKVVSANPFQQFLREKTLEGTNDKTRFFDRAERAKIIACLGKPIDTGLKEPAWTMLRDRAMISVMLGGGVKVNEMQSLTVSCIRDGGHWLEIPGAARSGHRTKLMPFAAAVLEQWVQLRSQLALPGDTLFPAVKIGRSTREGDSMHAATIFRRVQSFLDTAGIQPRVKVGGMGGEKLSEKSNRACGQTLRNTYAAMLFDEGAPDDLVKQNLGLEKEVSVARLRASYNQT